jgi:hypothetical protein
MQTQQAKQYHPATLGELVVDTYEFLSRSRAPDQAETPRQVAKILQRQLKSNPKIMDMLFSSRG